MIYENWLHTSSLKIKAYYCLPLKEDIKTDCLIIGGGFAGLHAALRLVNAGKQVVLLEKTKCGGGSSGQSAGFLAPESEKDINQLTERYGEEKAKLIYDIPRKGAELIINTAKKYNFECDLRKQDSLYLAFKKSHDYLITEEKDARKENNLPSTFYNSEALKKIHPGKYTSGLRYPGSYGINSFAYCEEMKNLLLKKGVKIFENSEVKGIKGNTAETFGGSVTAKNILICMNKMKTEFNKEISKKFYHLQTYLAVSEPLSKSEMKSIFPNGEFMCWDTRMIYAHYRPVMENRILIGGSTAWAYYSPTDIRSPKIIEKFIKELKKRFPGIKNAVFNNYWSGLIDVTQDLEPIIDYDKNNKSIQYAMGCAGLPWAAYCGDYIARRLLDSKKTEDLSEFTRIDRKFFLPARLRKIFGKRITFALSHLREYLRA